MYFVVDLNIDEKTDLKQILFLNSPKYGNLRVLTFLSPVRHCHQPRSHTAASATAVAFVDCTDIIIVLLLLVDLLSDLGFIDEVVQYLEFNAHLESVLSVRSNQVTRYEQSDRRLQFATLSVRGNYPDDVR